MPVKWHESLELIEKYKYQIKPKSNVEDEDEDEVDDGRWKLYASQLKENSST